MASNNLVVDGYVFSEFYENEEAIRDEHTFDETAFLTSHIHKDLIAFAKRIQALLLMEKGTNPAAVDMGVGIRKYLMEFQDRATINEMRKEIDSQIDKYLPNDIISNIEVKINPRQGETGMVYILFEIHKGNRYDITNPYFAIQYNGNEILQSTKVISQLLL